MRRAHVELNFFSKLKKNIKNNNFQKVEQKFLASKPACFLVVGKPGSGKTTIAKKLAMEWKAEFVNCEHHTKREYIH
jgi:SpoVK/Ycf46/Vps4 family AAA+-type ATPase